LSEGLLDESGLLGGEVIRESAHVDEGSGGFDDGVEEGGNSDEDVVGNRVQVGRERIHDDGSDAGLSTGVRRSRPGWPVEA